MTGFNIDRLHPYQANPEYRRAAHGRVARHGLQVPLPDHVARRRRAARSRSPFHDRLGRGAAPISRTSAAGRARTGTRPPGSDARRSSSCPGAGRIGFRWWQAEHEAAREGVIVMDMSFMGKFLVQGRDAGRVLNHISGQQRDGAAGVITYTQWLNERGMLEADLTVTKLTTSSFFVVVTDTMLRHAETWMKRHIPDDAHAFVTDVTSGYGQLNVQGPQVAGAVADADHASTCPTRRFRSARRARSTSASRVCCACASPMWASWATSSTSPPSRRLMSTTGSSKRASAFGLRHAGLKALGQPAHGKGLSRLRPRHRQYRRSVRGRPGLRRRSEEAGLHRRRPR